MKIRLLFLLCTGTFSLAAQDDPDSRFSPITPAMLAVKSYPIDTGAPAVVLAEYGVTKINGNNDGGFEIECRIRRRIHLLKNTSFDKATVSIDLYTDGDAQEKIIKLNAVTYRLDGGKLAEIKLNGKSDVFTEKVSRNLLRRKFTLPGIKEGAIIDYEYTVTSGFLFNLQPWNFQGDIPCLWSEYRAAIPQFLNYMMLQQGTLPFTVETSDEKLGAYEVSFMKDVYAGKTVNERVEISCIIANNRWVISNVPAFKAEAYTSTPENYVNKIQFQLAGFQKPLAEKNLLSTWQEYSSSMLKGLDFINEMENTGEWWPDEIRQVLKGANTETDIAKAIYGYVSGRFSQSGDNRDGKRTSLKKVAAAKSGTPLEINLLLTAMLRYAGLKADPVMLSTREHGYSTEAYPIIGQLNYLVCRVHADDDDWLLDANHPFLGFGKLPYNCYNGQARVLNTEATLIHLSPDQLNETDQVTVEVKFSTTGEFHWDASVDHRFGFFASEQLRQRIRKDGLESVKKELMVEESEASLIKGLTADPLDNAETLLSLKYTTGADIKTGSVIYFPPVLIPQYRQNPLKSAERKYPVEMPYRVSQKYSVTILVPEGYQVEELPTPLSADLNGKKDASFDYTVNESDGRITIQYGLEITKTYFKPDEYKDLREFFSKITAKLEQQIVFRKK